MILADKIIRLRKKNGWSQEELAEKMHVSRQAVSKWEGAQSVPDLEKVLRLSSLFGVTTDYLLKDEMESEAFTDENAEPDVRRVSMEEANAFLELRKKASVRIALATFLCILSPICLLILGAASEVPSMGISENFAGAAGLIALLLFVAAASGIYILCGFQSASYEFLEKEPFETEYGVTGMVREREAAYRRTYMKYNITGACLCVLSPIPLFIGSFTENGFLTTVTLTMTMVIAGAGVVFFIIAGVRWASMQKLLQNPDYIQTAHPHEKSMKSNVSTIYWLIATAVYLAWSFLTNDWQISWIVWPVAGVLFGAVMAVCNLFEKRK
ncbi:MAG: helix-turn-helix domain-containing protein [Ruminococcus sp.]